MLDSASILHDLDLLDDWLAGKGYGEEAGLVLRAMTLINKQARELRTLRAALKPFAAPDWCEYATFTGSDLRQAAAAYKETGND